MEKEIRFKTQGELAAYLINKGPLRVGRGGEIYFDPVNHPGDPFRFKTVDDGSAPMLAVWDVESIKYYTETPWQECIPEGKLVPCYVSDCEKAPGPGDASSVVRYSDEHGCYIAASGTEWKYATPIPADKVWIPGPEE